MGGLELLQIPLRVQLRDEALPRALALHQRGVQLGVVVRVQLLQELRASGAVDLACQAKRVNIYKYIYILSLYIYNTAISLYMIVYVTI